uniref:COMM domain-containing protein n=1 Tax=Setaria digitata TaxID=48799 RepID=A0A915PY91_9BILA
MWQMCVVQLIEIEVCLKVDCLVNVAGSDESNRRGKMFVNIEFRTKGEEGAVKLRNVQISTSEFVGFLQQLREIQEESERNSL